VTRGVGTSHKSTVLTLIDSFARTARHAGLPRNRRRLATARSKRFSVAILARKALIARKVMVPAVVAVRLPIVPNAATETNRAGSRRTVVVRLAAVKLRAAGAGSSLHNYTYSTYNAGQCTHIYLASSNTPTALRRPRHGSGPSTPGPGPAWASPRERPPRSLAPALVPEEY
jgi:hypothetical protein